jgi:hypothetical protein
MQMVTCDTGYLFSVYFDDKYEWSANLTRNGSIEALILLFKV